MLPERLVFPGPPDLADEKTMDFCLPKTDGSRWVKELVAVSLRSPRTDFSPTKEEKRSVFYVLTVQHLVVVVLTRNSPKIQFSLGHFDMNSSDKLFYISTKLSLETLRPPASNNNLSNRQSLVNYDNERGVLTCPPVSTSLIGWSKRQKTATSYKLHSIVSKHLFMK